MLKCYYAYIADTRNGKRIGCTSAFLIEDESLPHEPVISKITWDNCEQPYIGRGWYIENYKHGRAAFFDDNLLPFALERRGEPLNINRTISYKEANASINDILKYHDGDVAIRYLIERGLTVIPNK